MKAICATAWCYGVKVLNWTEYSLMEWDAILSNEEIGSVSRCPVERDGNRYLMISNALKDKENITELLQCLSGVFKL